MLGTLHVGCRPRTVRGAAGALVLAATVLAAAPVPAGAVLDGYRVSVAVTDGVLIVEEKSFTGVNAFITVRKDPTTFLVTIIPGDNFDTVGPGCTLFSSSGNALIATCVGATRMIYRGKDGQPVFSKVSLGGPNQGIPLQLEALLATGSLGSDNEFLITFENANLPNVVDAGGGTDTLSLRSIVTVVGQQQPVFHYVGDGIANDGYDGLATMNLNGFEKFNLAGAGDIHAGPEDNVLDGGFANDFFFGNGGADIIHGGGGNDQVVGNDGDDLLFGGDGNDQLSAGAGNDTLSGDLGVDTLQGSTGNDLLQTRDGITEALISCGDGVDTAQIDLKDPKPTGCETVERQAVKEGPAVRIARVKRTGRRIAVTLACPRRHVGRCAGKLDVGGKPVSYSIRPGSSGAVTLTRRARGGQLRSVEHGRFGLMTVTRVL
jgi:Ca2+-binding RTX toxin-like protein